jgi:16S rRNA (adenine1518-N6/adenine1519-N6)-dimethyltransferase
MRAKKSYGQHFLHNTTLAERIGDMPDYEACPRALEVGPGRAALTRPLLQHPIDLKVVEADRDMISYLKTAHDIPLREEQIIASDILDLDLSKVFDGLPFILIGNYPYNISSQILIHLLKYRDYIPETVGMFQREVAERVVSHKGSKAYGTLSVLLQVYYDFRIAFRVSPGNFTPPPKVDSAILHGQRREKPLFDGPLSALQAIVRAIFGKRRKMIRNSLKSLLPAESFADWPYQDQRPEQLSIEQFVELADRYANYIENPS